MNKMARVDTFWDGTLRLAKPRRITPSREINPAQIKDIPFDGDPREIANEVKAFNLLVRDKEDAEYRKKKGKEIMKFMLGD